MRKGLEPPVLFACGQWNGYKLSRNTGSGQTKFHSPATTSLVNPTQNICAIFLLMDKIVLEAITPSYDIAYNQKVEQWLANVSKDSII